MYVCSKGFQCFSETLFEGAGDDLFTGSLDPRALINYFPDLHGSLFNEKDTLDVRGVAENMPPESSVDGPISLFLPLSFLPNHLHPSTFDSIDLLSRVFPLSSN